MIYWGTDAQKTSPSTKLSFSSYKTNRFHVAMDLYSNRSGAKYIMYYILVLTTF